MFCPSCGTKNEGSKFCSNCGAKLDALNENQGFTQNPNMNQNYNYNNNQNVYNQGYKVYLYDRFSLILYIILSMLTFGIYSLVITHRMIKNINIAATPYDHKETPSLVVLILLSFITFGIYSFVFFHKFSNRVGDEARRRGMYTTFSASDYWIWNILLSFIFGSLVYYYKLFKTLNYISRDYNTR